MREECVFEAPVGEERLFPGGLVPAARGEPRRTGRVVAHVRERPAEVLLERVPVEGEERVAVVDLRPVPADDPPGDRGHVARRGVEGRDERGKPPLLDLRVVVEEDERLSLIHI